jgi:hypothetical protein
VRAAAIAVGLVVALFGACSSNKANQLPAEVWGMDDYVKAGVPALDHPWTVDDHEVASTVLLKETQGHRNRLPHKDGARSGALFARIAEPPAAPVADAPADQTFILHARRFEAANEISKLYTVDAFQTANAEYAALTGVLLHEAAILMVAGPAFLATFPADDPSRPVREEGLGKMRTGWGQMLLGALAMCGDTRIPEPTRVTLARDVRSVWDKLYPSSPADLQDMIKKQLSTLHGKLPDGPLRQALPPPV